MIESSPMLATLQTAASIALELDINEIFINYRVTDLMGENDDGIAIDKLLAESAARSEE